MTRRIASPGPQASQSLSRRPPFLEDFPIRSTKAAKYSPIRARKNPCATGIGTVFSQTLFRDDGRLARFDVHGQSFLVLATGHHDAGDWVAALSLGSGCVWPAQLPFRSKSNKRKPGDKRALPLHPAPDLCWLLPFCLWSAGWSLVVEDRIIFWG